MADIPLRYRYLLDGHTAMDHGGHTTIEILGPPLLVLKRIRRWGGDAAGADTPLWRTRRYGGHAAMTDIPLRHTYL